MSGSAASTALAPDTSGATKQRATVAAVIPTKNVADFIAGALESLRFCDEVIIVDMFSTDDTQKICESYPNVRFFQRQDYIYGNFNFGMEQAQSEWIIRLDSDERLSPELQAEIEELLRGNPQYNAYDAPFTSYVLSFPIRHGLAWEKPKRITLFRRGKLRYKVQSEHEELSFLTNEETHGVLVHPYAHFSMPTTSKFIAKMDYYAEWDLERTDPAVLRVLPPWRLMIAIVKYFFHYYIFRKGFRDGRAGFAICALNAVNRLVFELKVWEYKEGLRSRHRQVRLAYDERLRTHADAKGSAAMTHHE